MTSTSSPTRNRLSRNPLVGFVAWGVIGLATMGCAQPKWAERFANVISPPNRVRTDDAVQTFDTFRTKSQLQSAVARWKRRDYGACETTLKQIVEREPQEYEARMMLADLYAATDRPEEAEKELRVVLKADPDNAQANHSLGLLLESNGKESDSLAYLKRAMELEPENRLYALSHETTLIASRKPTRLPSDSEYFSASSSASDDGRSRTTYGSQESSQVRNR